MASKKVRTITRTVKAKSRRRQKFTLPVAVMAGFAPAVFNIAEEGKASGWMRAMKVQAPKSFMAYNPDIGRFSFEYLEQGLGPIILGGLVHWGIGGKLGVNRMLGKAKVPVIRL